MSARDRTVTLILVIAAIVGWITVALVFLTITPEGDAGAQLLGALALGVAVGLTVWPLLWSVGRGRPDALTTSARRSALVGLVITILVVLRAIDVVALPVVVFLVVGAVLVEVGFTLRH